MESQLLITKPVSEINELFYLLGFKKNNMFKPYDYLRSDTAKRCNILNEPDSLAMSNIVVLNNTLLDILGKWSFQAPHITSGFRCVELNRLVGGVDNSRHRLGLAVDLWLPHHELQQLYSVLSKAPHRELIMYKTFLHFAL